jgi:nitrate reductase delta subunit
VTALLRPPAARATVSPYKLGSVLLQYPTRALFDGIAELDAAIDATSAGSREPFRRFVSWLRTTSTEHVAQHYVETFDLRRRCTLYLTYYRYGDTRKRGMSMLAFKAAYRGAGFDPNTDELPDYLPMVLDFAALAPRGESLLRAHRADLELVRIALHDAKTPYADVIDGVCATLPKLGRREAAKAREILSNGPPEEDVGLEPFAPPEYLSGYGTHDGGHRDV